MLKTQSEKKLFKTRETETKKTDIKKQKKTTKQFRKSKDLSKKKSHVGLKDVYYILFFVFILPTKPVCDKCASLLL